MSSDHKTKPNRQAGFSLLELLVSITIMGFVGSAMAAGVRLGLNVWQSSNAQNQALYDSGALNQSLRPLLAQADPRLFKQDGGISTLFYGSESQLFFLSRSPQSLRGSAAHIFEIAQDADALLIRMRRFDPQRASELTAQTPTGEQGPPTRLLKDVTDVQFRYFGEREGSATPYWAETWIDQPALPQLVEMTLRPATSARWQLPPIVFALETAL